MSDVNGCKFYVFNAASGPISGSVTQNYHDKPSTELSFDSLGERTMTELVSFDSGTNHHSLWQLEISIGGQPKRGGEVKDKVKQPNTNVVVVVSDWGFSIVPQVDAAVCKAYDG